MCQCPAVERRSSTRLAGQSSRKAADGVEDVGHEAPNEALKSARSESEGSSTTTMRAKTYFGRAKDSLPAGSQFGNERPAQIESVASLRYERSADKLCQRFVKVVGAFGAREDSQTTSRGAVHSPCILTIS